MAAPLGGVTAAQIAQQQAQSQGTEQVAKQGPSKFDQALQSKGVQGTEATSAAQASRQVQGPEQVRQVEQVNKSEKAGLKKVSGAADAQAPHSARAMSQVTEKSEVSKTTQSLAKMLEDIEKGQGVMDKLIRSGVSGKEFSSSELLALQAGMYKYTQELELTGKVVEKATTGLKDTLKTQV